MTTQHGTRTGWKVDDERLPAWIRRENERQKNGPWCVCGNSMSQEMYDEGFDTHPVCGPHDKPHPRSAS